MRQTFKSGYEVYVPTEDFIAAFPHGDLITAAISFKPTIAQLRKSYEEQCQDDPDLFRESNETPSSEPFKLPAFDDLIFYSVSLEDYDGGRTESIKPGYSLIYFAKFYSFI